MGYFRLFMIVFNLMFKISFFILGPIFAFLGAKLGIAIRKGMAAGGKAVQQNAKPSPSESAEPTRAPELFYDNRYDPWR